MLATTVNVLERATPESQGIGASAILEFVHAVERQNPEFHSFMLLRHGYVVAEGWWSPYAAELTHMLFSLSKSFTSTAIGLAVEEGLLSIDDRVVSFFPDETPAEMNAYLAAMQVRHLLSMSTGQAEDTMPALFEQGEGNWVKGFFEIPVLYEPGTHFLYNTGATYMLSAILQKVSGQKLMDYLTPRLFEPLGIEGAFWEESPNGVNMGGFGLNAKTEDIAKFGQLYLQKGMWGNTRILPEAWVEEATSIQISNGDNPDSDWAQGYGYQFWRSRHNSYRGDGAFGQYCLVMPEQDAVLAIIGGLPDMQIPLNLVWDILLPAMSDDALPDDAEAQAALTAKLSSLTFLPIEGERTSSMASKVSGRTFAVEPNPLHIEAITLHFDEDSCTSYVKTALGEESFTCGYSRWREGETALFSEPPRFEVARILASGTWTAEDTFTMIVRLYETPFLITLVDRFSGDRLDAETTINVAFDPNRTLKFVGYTV